MELISGFFLAFTLQRVISTFITGFILGRIFQPTKTEAYKFGTVVLGFLLIGFFSALLSSDILGVGRSIAGLVLWLEFMLAILLGKESHRMFKHRWL